MTGYFGLHAERLAAYGYDVIPISLPTDGGNSPGKRPAQSQGWTAGLRREAWPAFARYGVGVLTRNTPALDIDVLDPWLVEKIQSLADQALGDAPYRIGAAPKRLVPYRLAGARFGKIKLIWRGLCDEPHEPNAPPAVELLSDGQQFVALGVHPGTGQPYQWHRDPDLEIPHGLLPALDRAKAERFMRALAGALEHNGATNIKLTGITLPDAEAPPPARPVVASGRHPAAEFLAKHGIDFNRDVASRATNKERITTALDHMGNPDRHYDDWIRIGHAIKAESARPAKMCGAGGRGSRTKNWTPS